MTDHNILVGGVGTLFAFLLIATVAWLETAGNYINSTIGKIPLLLAGVVLLAFLIMLFSGLAKRNKRIFEEISTRKASQKES